MLRDILNYSEEEIDKMGLDDYITAIHYCWNTYTIRRVDYSLSKLMGGKDTDENGKVNIDFSPLNPITAEWIEKTSIEKLAARSVIPEREKK